MSNQLRVLIAEDQEDDMLLVLRELKRGGYDVDHARVETAEMMEHELRTRAWDMIVSDYSMPQFSALGALAVMKKSGLDLPFIIVSGTVGEDVAVAALKGGAHDFIPKNNLRRFLPAVERELREADGRRRREAAERELRTSNEILSAVFDASPIAMTLLTPSGEVQRWNRAAEVTFGWTADEVIGKREPFVTAEQEDSFQRHLTLLRSGGRINGEEIARTRKDGRSVILNLSAAPVFDAGGQILSILELLLDVTEQRALEGQLRQSQKMEAVGRLAGGIAHDFNNVLTVIEGFSSLILADMPADDPRKNDVREILNAAERAAAFTRQLLTFSRKQVVQPEVIELNALVSGLNNLLKRALGDDILLGLDLSDKPNRVLADPGQLEQVCINLVLNARDALAGHGKITLRTSCVHIDDAKAVEQNERPGSYCVLSVTDNGSGIEPDLLPLIFEPFFTTKEAGKGTGLGLSTVYGIVVKNDGFIRVNSEVGTGTTFSVFLPEVTVGMTEQVVEQSPPSAPITKRNPTVLVVEDQVAIQKVIARTLENAGYHVFLAGDGPGALLLLQNSHDIDLLLTDVMLPNMRGQDLAREALQFRPNLQIILMSGYSEDDIAAENRFRFIEKPFRPADLLRQVDETLRKESAP